MYIKINVSFSGIFVTRKQVNLLKSFPTLIWVHISSISQDFCPFFLRLWREPFWCQRLLCRRGAGWVPAGSSGCHLESKFSLRIRNDLQSVAKLIGQTVSLKGMLPGKLFNPHLCFWLSQEIAHKSYIFIWNVLLSEGSY